MPERLLFMGHMHRWFAASTSGPLDWSGTTSLHTGAGGRRLVIVGAVCRGHCAWLDTTSGVLRPVAMDR